MATARKLSPAFYAECAAAEKEAARPKGFWQRVGFAFGWLRANFVKLLLLAGMIWVFVLIAPFLEMLIQALCFLLPVWFLSRLAGASDLGHWQAFGFRPTVGSAETRRT